MNKISFGLIAIMMGALTAQADSLVTIRPAGTDSVDWSVMGPEFTALPSPFYFATA